MHHRLKKFQEQVKGVSDDSLLELCKEAHKGAFDETSRWIGSIKDNMRDAYQMHQICEEEIKRRGL